LLHLLIIGLELFLGRQRGRDVKTSGLHLLSQLGFVFFGATENGQQWSHPALVSRLLESDYDEEVCCAFFQLRYQDLLLVLSSPSMCTSFQCLSTGCADVRSTLCHFRIFRTLGTSPTKRYGVALPCCLASSPPYSRDASHSPLSSVTISQQLHLLSRGSSRKIIY